MDANPRTGDKMTKARRIAPLVGTAILLVMTGCCTCRQSNGGPGPGRTRLLTIAGPQGALAVEDGGRGGVPVLFVHGLAGDHRVWADQLGHLRASRRAVALDLRGHGGSQPAADGDYSIEGFAQDVGAVADALHLSRFVLVGHSLGGLVVTAYAGRHPQRVAGVLYADPAGDLTGLPEKDKGEWLASLAPDTYATSSRDWFKEILQGAPPAVRQQVLATLGSTSPDVVRAAVRGLLAYDPKPDLRAYKGPRLTVVTPLNEKPYSLQNLVPDLPFTVMTGTSHWVMMDKPAEFDAILDSFLAKVKD